MRKMVLSFGNLTRDLTRKTLITPLLIFIIRERQKQRQKERLKISLTSTTDTI
jgi:hypothetical protein